MEPVGDLRTPSGLVVPGQALIWSFARSGGPGGQHVNTTSTKVTLTVPTDAVTGDALAVERVLRAHPVSVRVTSQESRSQWRNRQRCLARAAELLDSAARPPDAPRRPSRPTRGAVERRLEGKRRTSEKKASRGEVQW